jgi:hypothetical protein
MMKDSIFTPGPGTQHNTTWEVGDGNTVMPIISDSPDMVGQRLVALVRDRKDNGLINATLIAAAPDMLDALKAIRDGCGPNTWEGQKASEAINKAAGR